MYKWEMKGASTVILIIITTTVARATTIALSKPKRLL